MFYFENFVCMSSTTELFFKLNQAFFMFEG